MRILFTASKEQIHRMFPRSSRHDTRIKCIVQFSRATCDQYLVSIYIALFGANVLHAVLPLEHDHQVENCRMCWPTSRLL